MKNKREIKLTPSKTYKTKANMEKAIKKAMDNIHCQPHENMNFKYLTQTTEDGRYYPIFISNGNGDGSIFMMHEGFCLVA